MTRRCFKAVLGLILGALTVPLVTIAGADPARAIPLDYGETLRVHFAMFAPPNSPIAGLPPSHPLNIADVLVGTLNVTQLSGIGAPAADIALYDGNALLGSYSLTFSAPSTSFAFAGPGSIFNFRSGTASDLSSLEDGTIDGILEITSRATQPFPSVPRAMFDFSVSSLSVGHTTQTQGYHPLTPSPQIVFQGRPEDDPFTGASDPEAEETDPATDVPEPEMALLFSLALIGITGVRAHHRRRHLERTARRRLARRIDFALAAQAA